MRSTNSLVSFILFLILTSFQSAQAKEIVVGISQIVEHPSLDEIREGLISKLKKSSFSDKITIKYFNAQGDMITSAQIAQNLIGDKPDVLVGISTPSAQHLLSKNKKIPVVFSGVNDPVGARLVSKLDKPGGNVTGVMLPSPIKEQLELILKLKPSAKKIGIIYNAGEDNSVSIAKEFSNVAKSLGLKDVPVSVSKSAQVQAAALALSGRVDAIYIPTDNTVISALGVVLKAGKTTNIPVFTGDVASVEQGALAALGVDHIQLGEETANLVLKILSGEKVADLSVEQARKNSLYINLKFANDNLGVTFPVSVLKSADKFIR